MFFYLVGFHIVKLIFKFNIYFWIKLFTIIVDDVILTMTKGEMPRVR
ncbi:hypothetical protein D922_00856 [Enterococcus faecalis 06-MB-DW-09]|nr:hypothetical protein D922_00856 [Enterococcus faecalis 06-MB-DW-09]